MKIKNIVLLMSRIFLGGVFIYAGVVKIIQPAEFADAIDNYRIMPYLLVTIMAVVLPWVEVIAGLLLVVGRWLKSSSFIIIVLNIIFIVAISSAMIRGLDIDCGCFSESGSSKVGVFRLVEDFVYLILAVIIFRSGQKKTN